MIKLIKLTEADDQILIEPKANKEEISDENEVDIDIPTNNIEDDIEISNDVDPNVFANACIDQINSLTTNCWDFISSINGLIATLDFDYKGENAIEIKNVLNSIIDESTINVGMLQKVAGLLDSKKADLINSGINKAEEIISDHPVEDTEEDSFEVENEVDIDVEDEK